MQQHGDVGRAGLAIHGEDRDQHEERADERVEKELEARVDAPLAAPDSDDEKHRNEAALEEEIEQHDVERAEDAYHQRLEHQEGDHIFLHALLDRVPGGENGEGHQEGRQQDEGHRKAVDAHLVDEARAEPVFLLDELKRRACRVEAGPDDKRQREGRECGRQRRPSDVAQACFIVALLRQQEGDADQRQKGDAGENAETEHQRSPPATKYVTTAATPMSMAKA